MPLDSLATPREGPTLQDCWERLLAGGERAARPADVGGIDAVLLALEKIPGVILGPDRLVRLGVTLSALADRGVILLSGSQAADVLIPLLTVNGEAQKAAREELEKLWPEGTGRSSVGSKQEAPPAMTLAKELKQRRNLLIAAIFGIIAVTTLVLALVPGAQQGVSLDTPSISPQDVLQGRPSFWPWLASFFLTDLIHRLFAVAAVAAAALIWWNGARQQQQEQLSRGEKTGAATATMTAAAQEILFPTAVLRRAGRLMRRPIKVAGHRVDVKRSVDASIKADGYPIIFTGLEARTPDCLLLVDRISANDHLAPLADALAKRLRDGGADIYQYEFRETPEVLEAVGRRVSGQPVLSLEALARRHPGARIVIVSTGQGFFDRHAPSKLRLTRPFFGEPDEFPFVDYHEASLKERQKQRILPAFRDPPILLTPTPADRWGPTELTLQSAGFAVVSLGSAEHGEFGLEIAIDAMISNQRPHAVDRHTLTYSTPGHDPLLQELERIELINNIPPPDQVYRDRLARRVMSYASARIGDDMEGVYPEDPYEPDPFVIKAEAGLAALALFPRLDPAFTTALWTKATGHIPSAARLARLARLPWFRIGRMPDWLRTDLANHFRRQTEKHGNAAAWEELRKNLTIFASECLDRETGGTSLTVYRQHDSRAQWLERLNLLRKEASPASRAQIEERLFIAFLDKGEIGEDDIGIDLPPLTRPTQTMRLGLLGFGVAAVIAALVTPWLLRGMLGLTSQWAQINPPNTDPRWILPLLGIQILTLTIFQICAAFMKRTSQRTLIIFTLLIVTFYPLQYLFVEGYLKTEQRPSYSILYFSFPAILAVILTSERNHIPRILQIAAYPRIVEAGALSAILATSFAGASPQNDNIFLYTIYISATCALVFFFIARVSAGDFAMSYVLACCAYSILLFLLFGLAALGRYMSLSIYFPPACAICIGLLCFAAFFPPGTEEKRQFFIARLTFFGIALSTSMAGFIPIGRGFISSTAILFWTGSGLLAVTVAWLLGTWLLIGRASVYPLTAAIDLFRRGLSDRISRGSGWVELVAKAVLAGVTILLVATSISSVFVAAFMQFAKTDVYTQAAAVLNAPLSSSTPENVLYRLTSHTITSISVVFVIGLNCTYLALAMLPSSEPEKTRKAYAIQISSQEWRIVPQLWAIVVVASSLQTWGSALNQGGDGKYSVPIVFQGQIMSWLSSALFSHSGSVLPLLGYLAVPVAVHFGLKRGSASNLPILVGLLPFLNPLKAGAIITPGGFWIVPLVFLFLRLARDPHGRSRLLRFGGGFGDAPPRPFVILVITLGLALFFSAGLVRQSSGPLVDAAPVRAALFLLLGSMLLPARAILGTLAILAAIALAGGRFDIFLADTGIRLIFGPAPQDVIDMAVAYAALPIARHAWLNPTAKTRIALALAAAVTLAIVLRLGSPSISLGLADYQPSGMPLIILSLTLGLVIASQNPWRHLSEALMASIGALVVVAAARRTVPILQWNTTGIRLPDTIYPSIVVSDMLTTLPALLLVAAFAWIGNAVAGELRQTYYRLEPDEAEKTFNMRSRVSVGIAGAFK